MSTVYVLKLEGDKYYIGSTNQLEVRINSHLTGAGALWTKMYKPIEVVAVYRGCDEYDEDKYVKKYMQSYGIDNVRGGTYVLPRLDADTKAFIQKELIHASRACFKCGKIGHYIKDCPLKTSPQANFSTPLPADVKWTDTSILSGAESGIEVPPGPPSSPPSPVQPEFVMAATLRPAAVPISNLFKCTKCGSTGHIADNCYTPLESGVTSSAATECKSDACNVRVFSAASSHNDPKINIITHVPDMPPVVISEPNSFRENDKVNTECINSEDRKEEGASSDSSNYTKKETSPKGECQIM